VSEVWIVNASPVIVLAKAHYSDLLVKLSTSILLPEVVAQEILAGPLADPARKLVENGWGETASPHEIPQSLLEWGLGSGETAVLSLALERAPATAVPDDAAARTCAQAIHVPMIGTLGILLRAKRHGLLNSAAVAIKAIQDVGLHLDETVIARALEHVGEKR